MKENRLHFLMQKYIAHECNADEIIQLALLIDALKNEELKSELLKQWNIYQPKSALSEDKSRQILSSILTPSIYNKPTRFIKRSSSTIHALSTAAAVLIILLSVGLFFNHLVSKANTERVIAKASIIIPQQKAAFIRNITLSDGSTVILRAGSTIHYPHTFAGNTREITLVGEAYFDIQHNDQKPFIIHTGGVKTVVLGTAFDITAWPGQKNIIVSVTRGKVRVENETKILAILTKDQQMNFDVRETIAKQEIVNADEIVNDWTKQDMNFEKVTFGKIASILSQRYGKDIVISNLDLANTQIVSSFNGTESLDDVLEVLCAINPKTSFKINRNEITISNTN